MPDKIRKRSGRETRDNTPKDKVVKGVITTCRYRLLAYQPLSVDMDSQVIDGLSIQKTTCSISIRSMQEEKSLQLLSGGSLLAIEFEGDVNADLLMMARRGLSLLEDFLRAIALEHHRG